MKSKFFLPVVLIVSLIHLSYFSPALSAEVYKAQYGDHSDEQTIVIQGVIEEGDFEKVVKLTTQFIRNKLLAHYTLNSPGGDVVEAMKIGEFLSHLNATTRANGVIITADELNKATLKGIDKIVKCQSACFIILVSGAQRSISENMILRDHTPIEDVHVLGMHRPYFDPKLFAKFSPERAKTEYRKLTKIVRRFLVRAEVQESFVDELFRYSSNEIRIIPQSEFRKKIGYYKSFLDEWFIAKCGKLSKKETSDLAEIIVEQALNKNKSSIPKGMPVSYANYLRDKNEHVIACREKSVLDHQQNSLRQYEKNLN
jgi:hypothetical protein